MDVPKELRDQARIAGVIAAAVLVTASAVAGSEGAIQLETTADLEKAEALSRRLSWPRFPTHLSPELAPDRLGGGRMRELRAARFDFALHFDPLGEDHDLLGDPERLEDAEDAVLSAFLKLEREYLEEALGINAWLDRQRARLRPGRRDAEADDGPGGPSWRMRFSPQVSVGSSNRLGLKLSLPDTGRHFWDHLSFRVRHDFDDDRFSYIFKFDDGDRYFYLAHEPGTEERGDSTSFNVHMRF